MSAPWVLFSARIRETNTENRSLLLMTCLSQTQPQWCLEHATDTKLQCSDPSGQSPVLLLSQCSDPSRAVSCPTPVSWRPVICPGQSPVLLLSYWRPVTPSCSAVTHPGQSQCSDHPGQSPVLLLSQWSDPSGAVSCPTPVSWRPVIALLVISWGREAVHWDVKDIFHQSWLKRT